METQPPETPWQFNEDETEPGAPQAAAPTPTHHDVQWSASEFVAHQKGSGWYLLLALVTVVLAVGAYFLTRDYVTPGVIIFAGVVFGFLAGRQPRVLQYIIDSKGLHIEDKLYHFDSFKSFAVVEDDAIHSVLLMPMKRFMPILSIYYAPEDENRIVDALAAYLPFQPAENDLIDRLMRKIRF